MATRVHGGVIAPHHDLTSARPPGPTERTAGTSLFPAVRINALRRSYGERDVIRHLDLQIGSGEFVALLGASGCGKTTLLRTLAGLDTADAGTVEVPANRAVVFQEPRLLPWKKVWRNVVLGQRGAGARARSEAALAEVGLTAHRDAWPVTLSGGEAQRVALARALVREPALLLLDEPFAALDALTRIKMHALVRELCARHRPAVLFVTHDVDEAVLLADRILVMRDGAIAIDLDVALGERRRRSDPEFHALRVSLLAELGVVDDDFRSALTEEIAR